MKIKDPAGRIVGIVAIVLIAITMVTGNSAVQTRLVHIFTGKLKDSINGEILIGNISVKSFSTIVIDDLVILDNEPALDIHNKGFAPSDTLFRAEKVTGKFSLRSLFSGKGMHFSRFEIDDAVFNMVSETSGNWKKNYQRIFRTATPPEVPVAGPQIFDIRKLRFRNFNFRMIDMTKPVHKYKGAGFDWQHIDLMISELNARDVRLGGRRLTLNLTDLTFTERNGYGPARLKGDFDIGMGDFIIRDFQLTDSGTELNVPDITMSYKNAYSFSDFSRKVHFDNIQVGRSEVSGQTLNSILGLLPGNSLVFDVETLNVDGYVNDLNVKSLKLIERNSGTYIDQTGRVSGLCTFPDVFIDSGIKQLKFTSSGLTVLMPSLSKGTAVKLKNFAPGEILHFSGRARGRLNELSVDADLRLGTGRFSSKATISNLGNKKRKTEIKGIAETDNFNLGKLLNKKALGEFTACAGLQAILTKEETSVLIDSFKIDRLNALGYDYSGIKAMGRMTGRNFDGKIVCNDPNLNFLFQGICNFSTKTRNARYNFFANLAYADLKALNLDRRENVGTSRASCRMSSDFLRIVKGDGTGDIKIRDIILEDDNGEHLIGDATVESGTGSDGYRIKFSSRFADGQFSGTGSIPEFVKDLKYATTRRHLPSLYALTDRETERETGNYSVDFSFHDSRDLLSFIKPGLYIADSTAFHLDLGKNGNLLATLESPRLALSRNYLRNSVTSVDNTDGILLLTSANEEVRAADRIMHNARLNVSAEKDSVRMDLLFDGKDKESEFGEIHADGLFSRDAKDSLEILLRPLRSSVQNKVRTWNIAKSSIRIKGGDVDVDTFRISSNAQELIIKGGLSKSSHDSLSLDLKNIELGMARGFTAKDYGIEGNANGHAAIVSPLGKEMQIFIDILCDSLKVGNQDVGTMALYGNWDKTDSRLNIGIEGEKNGEIPILAGGFFDPDEKKINFKARLDKFNLAVAEPLVEKFISEPRGSASGEIQVKGSINAPRLGGNNLTLKDASFRLLTTGAAYVLNGPIVLNGRSLEFNGISLSDEKGGKGLMDGKLILGEDGIPYIDAGLQMQGLQLANLQEGNRTGLYGNLAAAGNVRVKGKLDDLNISGRVSTFGPGNVHVPLNTATAAASSDLLSFKKSAGDIYVDPYELMLNERKNSKQKHKGNVRLNLSITANREVNAMLELNKSTGNVITANGDGKVNLDMETASGKTSLTGDYIIRGGSFHFEVPGIVKKSFDLKDDSSVKFNGDIKNSTMDINAVYKLKTSLSALLSDSTSVSTRRPVECTINLRGQLQNPRISFGIEVPDLDPNSKTKMAEALNTEDKIQRQFIALLVMGTFLPNEQSGVVNGTNILYSNVGEIMSNQLNNILQKLDIPLDLGLGYQQNKGGTDIFDVAISTQLFNNRVEIGGTVGNRQYKTSKNPYGDVVGDIDISVKLDKQGQVKLNLFSHSADEFTSFLDYSQRNGIGVTYSREYDNFWKMLKEIFSKEKKKEREARREKKTLRIKQ